MGDVGKESGESREGVRKESRKCRERVREESGNDPERVGKRRRVREDKRDLEKRERRLGEDWLSFRTFVRRGRMDAEIRHN